MRSWMFLLVAFAFVGSLAGCYSSTGCGTGCGTGGTGCGTGGTGAHGAGRGGHGITHGICDCDEDNHCLERAPWVRMAPPVPTAEPVAPPAKLPDIKKL